jgi:hypothetical protein
VVVQYDVVLTELAKGYFADNGKYTACEILLNTKMNQQWFVYIPKIILKS